MLKYRKVCAFAAITEDRIARGIAYIALIFQSKIRYVLDIFLSLKNN